jgi:hypothetical protein
MGFSGGTGDGRTVVTTGFDGYTKVWELLPEGDELRVYARGALEKLRP